MKGGSGTLSIKKISLFVLVFIMSMFTIHNVSASQRFVDVPSSHGASEEINYLVDLGVIKGYTENGKSYYKPNNPVTRGQAAKMVIESTDNKPLVVSKSSFSDIKLDLYPELSGYVESAVKLGFFTEYSSGKFAPNTPLSRNDMAKTLSIAFNLDVDKYANLTIPFTDVSPKDPYYKYIAAIYYNGITKGDENGTKYNPTKSVTRAQFASFIARSKEDKYKLDLPVQGVTVPNEEDAIGTVKATTDNLNVRSSASSSTSTNILGKVNTGTKLPVYKVEGSWLKVSYNGRYAYISSNYAQFLDQDGQPVGSVKKEVIANAKKVIVYKTRDINGKELGSYNSGDKIKVYKTVGNWYLTVQNGLPGYVRVIQTKEIEKEEPVVETPEEKPPVDDNKDDQLSTNTIGMATVNSLHIRSEASGTSKSLGTINRGTYVEVHSISGNWAKVTYNGIKGYIHKTYLRLINQSGSSVAGRIIVLDPGHGGKDPGTSKNGAIEKEIVLKVATKVKEKLEAAGAKVYMTRSGDTYPTLQDRVDYAANKYAEIFVSIHVNSASSESASGTETYYSISGENQQEDHRLASAINSQIVKNANMVDRGVRKEDYFVVRNLTLPSVLVELGFVTNASDREKLTSSKYIDIFADSIYTGIVQYYKK